MACNDIFSLHHSFFPDVDAKEGDNCLDDLFAALQTYQTEFDGDSACNNIFSLHHSFFPDVDAKEGDNCLDDLFVALQTYQMEFDGDSPIGRLPRCFAREFGDSINSYVILCDPCHNEIEVHVAKRSRELYFDEGWMTRRNIYDLWFGAWVTFAYVNPKLLTIRITTRWGTEYDYPVYNPPLQCFLPKVDSSPLIPPKSFVRSITKELTLYDLYSGTLILPWYGFGEFVYKFRHSDLILIDSFGDRYPCKLKFGVDPDGQLACKVSLGWVDYCTVHGVCQGDKIKASVMEPLHEYELYVSLYSASGQNTFEA